MNIHLPICLAVVKCYDFSELREKEHLFMLVAFVATVYYRIIKWKSAEEIFLAVGRWMLYSVIARVSRKFKMIRFAAK